MSEPLEMWTKDQRSENGIRVAVTAKHGKDLGVDQPMGRGAMQRPPARLAAVRTHGDCLALIAALHTHSKLPSQ